MSIELHVTAKGGRLVPTTPADAERLDDVEGEDFRAVLTQPKGRSNPQLRLYWGFCGAIADNLPEGVGLTSENVSDLIKLESGHALVFKDRAGRYRRLPKSISFAKLAQDDFNRVMDRAVDSACRLFSPSLSRAAWGEALGMMEAK